MITKRIFLLCLIFTWVNYCHAAHIVGGDVVYKCISVNTVAKTTKFRVVFTMYRDVFGGGANFDSPAQIGLFEKPTNSTGWNTLRTIPVQPMNIQTVDYEDKCVVLPPNLRIQRADYEFEIDLPWSTSTYQIAYQRCCRNNSINNILDPASTGAVFYIEIYGTALQNCNNSPQFRNFPPILICNGKPLNFPHDANDVDGDVLVYEFCTPLTSGGTDGGTTPGSPTSCTGVTPIPNQCKPPFNEVAHNLNYSGSEPMGGNPLVKIDATTGLITGVPNINGQFVVGVCAKEFRNGQLIGLIRRDFQFNVAVCQGVSATQNYTICDGDSVKVNNITYNQSGTFTQNFFTASGCDSTLNIVIKKNVDTEASISRTACFGTDIIVNNIRYSSSGIYTQKLKNKAGCDSTLTIQFLQRPKPESFLSFDICPGFTVFVNGQSYSDSGNYTQVVQNNFGCDSTINIEIKNIPTSASSLDIRLCDDASAIINQETYSNAGTYTQTLKNTLGCDSTLTINVTKGVSVTKNLSYSLCLQNNIVVNGQTYAEAGRFTQTATTASGCDSTIIIDIFPCNKYVQYDLEKCDALVPANSMVYTEFNPTYIGTLDCGSVTAKHIFRDEPSKNKHSCTQGNNNTIAMCVSASTTCNFEQVNTKPIVIEFSTIAEEGFSISVDQLVFFQRAPENYSWIAGSSGINNYPQKYAIKIFRNAVEIYSKLDVPSSTAWQEEKYNFFENASFTSSDSVQYRVEITPYCAIGNNGSVSVYDVDDIAIYVSCRPKNNRMIRGEIANFNPILHKATVRMIHENIFYSGQVSEDGSFLFAKIDPKKTYRLDGYSDSFPDHEVTALDIVLTQRHILGVEKFTHVYQYLAADVNNDQKITPADLLEMRKLIMGITERFTHRPSWIFINEAQINADINPWKMLDYYTILPGKSDINDLRFTAIKVGDVSGAASNVDDKFPTNK